MKAFTHHGTALHGARSKLSLCKKQYVYLVLAIVSICLALASDASAQEPNARAHEQNENTHVLPSPLRERVTHLVLNVETRMIAAHDRLSTIAGRLESRISKLKSQGYDTKGAEASLAEARRTLTVALQALSDIDITLERALAVEKPREAFHKVREQYTHAKNNILESHRLLRETVALLKESIRVHNEPADVRDVVSSDDEHNEE